MQFAAIAILADVFGVASAFNYAGAYQTGYVGLDPRGWSPQPTPAPHYHLYQRRQQNNDLTATCAYINAAPLACPSGQYCAYNSNIQFMGCCSVDANGQYDSDCYYTTTCVNQAQSSSICGTTSGCLGVQTGIWYVIDSCLTLLQYELDAEITSSGGNTAVPECLTIVLYYGLAISYTTFRCGTAAALITASVPPDQGATTTTSSSSGVLTTTDSFTSASTSTTTSSTSTTTPTPSPTPTPVPTNIAAIVGGVVGGVAGLALVGGIIGFIAYRIRVKKREGEYADDAPEIPGTAHTPK
jgi:hypothetical protein